MSALGCGPCGSANGVSIPAEARNTRAATSRETLDADPPNIDEEEFTRLMAWYTSASSLYNQARLTVEMLEVQRADGADVNEDTLSAARAMMAQTKKALDEVMLQAGG